MGASTAMGFTAVLPAAELWIGEARGLVSGGKRLLLVNTEGTIRAFEDRCAHHGWPLSKGKLAGTVLTCSLHGWCYDACTGLGLNPRGVALRCYGVRVANGDILVDVDGS